MRAFLAAACCSMTSTIAIADTAAPILPFEAVKEIKSYGTVMTALPKAYDPERPLTIVVYFHGNRDKKVTFVKMLTHQHVTEQVADADVNALLIVPDLSEIAWKGKNLFKRKESFTKLIKEACAIFTRKATPFKTCASARVILIAYSGGHGSARAVLAREGSRVDSVLFLDAQYNEQETFAQKAAAVHKAKSGYFVSAHTRYTGKRVQEFKGHLAEQAIPFTESIDDLRPGSVIIRYVPRHEMRTDDEMHDDFVTEAWTHHPITDFLRKIQVNSAL